MKNNRGRRIAKRVGEHKVTTGFIAAALVAGAVCVGNYVSIESQDGRRPVPAGSCESPFFATQHAGDRQASDLTQYLGGRTGVVLHVAAGEAARGVRAAYKTPGEENWREISAMVPVDILGKTTLSLAIGKGDVIFGVQTIAAEGDPICDQAPAVRVEAQGIGDYRNVPGQSPWLNLGEALTNVGIPTPAL